MSEPIEQNQRRNHAALCAQVRKIEEELRRLGYLTGPIGPAQTVNSAFGIGEMPFEAWLTKVFLPRSYESVASGDWPTSSHIGIAAIRNFDGLSKCDPLVDLLCDLDRMINAE